MNLEAQLYSYHAEMCKVLSHPKRLELIHVLREGEMTVGQLCQRLQVPKANLSQHLAMMRERRLLAARKAGNLVYYRIANPKFLQAFDTLREVLVEQIQHDAALLRGLRPPKAASQASRGG